MLAVSVFMGVSGGFTCQPKGAETSSAATEAAASHPPLTPPSEIA